MHLMKVTIEKFPFFFYYYYILFKKVGNARLGESDLHPMSEDPSLQYQPME